MSNEVPFGDGGLGDDMAIFQPFLDNKTKTIDLRQLLEAVQRTGIRQAVNPKKEREREREQEREIKKEKEIKVDIHHTADRV